MVRTRSPHSRVERRRGGRAALWVFFSAVVIAAFVLLAPQVLFPANAGLAQNANGTASVPASPSDATPLAATPSPTGPTPSAATPLAQKEQAATSAVAAPPQHLAYTAAGIDMAVDPLTPTGSDLASQSIVPPETTQAYWLSSFGKPGINSLDTTYIVGHSWENRDAPFNHLSTAAAPGDKLTLTTAIETIEYRVDSVETHDKDTLKTSAIWDIVPGRLVLISCYTEDPRGKNIVVSASPVKK